MQKGQGKILLVGLIVVFAIFQVVANTLGSDRGQYGVVVGLVVVAATLIAEKYLFRKSFRDAVRQIGLLRPERQGMYVAVAISAVLFLSVVVFGWLKNVSFNLYPRWYLLLPGLFFQAGIAEETLFRGYLFGHLQQRHSFGKAAVWAAIPFVLVHLILFYSLPWPIGAASILLSVAMSFPLSKLFDLGGRTIWAPAVVHFVSQSVVKVLVPVGESAWMFPFFWITACAVIPLGVYVIPASIGARSRPVAATLGLMILFLVAVPAVVAQSPSSTDHAPTEAKTVRREKLTGDWNGARTKLRGKGIEFQFRLTNYYQGAAVRDGSRSGAYSGKFDAHVRIDLEKLAGWSGWSAQIKTEARFGRLLSVGSANPLNTGVINPSAQGAKFAITALNVTKLFPVDREKGNFIAVGAGRYSSLDSSREPFTGGAGITRFMNVALTGNPAVGRMVPIVSNGANVAWVRRGTPVLTLAVFDPIAVPTRTGVRRLFREGMTFVPGFALNSRLGNRTGRHSFSAAITTRKFTPFDQLAQFVVPNQPTVPVSPKRGSWTLTYTAHQYLRETTDAEGHRTGWGIFGVATVADQATNPVARYVSVGVGGDGLFRRRKQDRFGVAYSFSGVSRSLHTILRPIADIRNEHNFEAFYGYAIAPWLTLTGDLQIVRPANRAVGAAVVPGARLVIDL